MAEVFAKFAIEIAEEFPSVINECIELMQWLKDVRITKTRLGTVIINYETPSSDVVYLEEKSKELCDKLEPFVKDFQAFFQKESNKIYKCIFFGKTSDGDSPVIKIDKQLLNLAYMLQTEIHFDGFWMKEMAEVYAEFGLEVYSDKFLSVIEEGIELMQQIGDIRTRKTRRGTVIISYETPCSDVVSIEEKSEELCDKLEPFSKSIQMFFQKEADKIYKSICFVKTSFKGNPVITINKRLLNIAYMLQTEIDFDLFNLDGD